MKSVLLALFCIIISYSLFSAEPVWKLEKDKDQCKENLKIVDSLKCKEFDIFDLDIGGTHKITTTRSTLTKVNLVKF